MVTAAHGLDRPATAPALYSQDGKGMEAVVHAHYFLGASDWLVSEYDPGDDIAFGWACLSGDRQSAELGYVSMAELESIAVPLMAQLAGEGTAVQLGHQQVERDTDWPAGLTLTEGIAELDRRHGR